MSAAEETIEQAHVRLGHTAPRVTENDLRAAIVGEYYFTGQEGIAGAQALQSAIAHGWLDVTNIGPDDKLKPCIVSGHPHLRRLTLCVLILQNGFMVVGHSAPVSPGNFDAAIGRKAARDNAFKQLWPLLGYALLDRVHRDIPADPVYSQVAAPVVVDDDAPAPIEGRKP